MEKLQSIEQFNTFKETKKVVFVFSADWCPDCRFIDPFMPEVEAKFSDMTFVYVDRDEFIDICAENDIYGIPSFLAFESGEETGRFVSKDRKAQQEIEAFLAKLA